MDFINWFYSSLYRTKYTRDSPVYLAATEAWDFQQAKIDRLMLKYCPEEMTKDQLQNYEKTQCLVKEK